MSIEHLRSLVQHLQKSANALAVLGAALDARVAGVELAPALRPDVDEVLAALGVADIPSSSDVELGALLGEIRTFALTNAKLLFTASRGPGWQHTEPELLEAAGAVSRAFPHALATTIAPKLDGLTERLARPGASFLDVGVGVGALSIEMARLWPELRVVGVDPLAPALALAAERVREAALGARIELRHHGGEALSDEDAFDLAWVASVFVPEAVFAEVLRRVHRALRPGGWLFLPVTRSSDDALASALARLRTRLFGGTVQPIESVEALLESEGFERVRRLPSPPAALTAMIVAQRGVARARGATG